MNATQKARLEELLSLSEKTDSQKKELQELQELEIKEAIEKEEKLESNFECEIKSIDEENFEIEAVASTASMDRYGDVVDQASWKLKRYKKNPVILANHFGSIQNIIGKAKKISVVDGKLVMKVKFAVKESELAMHAWKLIKGGFLNAWSVGFIPHEFDEAKSKDGSFYRILKNCELLEVSAVAIPANPDCLSKAVGSGVLTESQARDFEKAFGSDEKESEGELSTERKLELFEEHQEILKVYRKAFKSLNSTLNLTPSGNEPADVQKMLEMANFCLGLDDEEEQGENTDETENEKSFEEDQLATPLEAKARPATQADLERIKANFSFKK